MGKFIIGDEKICLPGIPHIERLVFIKLYKNKHSNYKNKTNKQKTAYRLYKVFCFLFIHCSMLTFKIVTIFFYCFELKTFNIAWKYRWQHHTAYYYLYTEWLSEYKEFNNTLSTYYFSNQQQNNAFIDTRRCVELKICNKLRCIYSDKDEHIVKCLLSSLLWDYRENRCTHCRSWSINLFIFIRRYILFHS